MRSYSEVEVFHAEELRLLGRAERIVEALPDEPGLRCHEVARIVGWVLGVDVQDGSYGMIEHSWLYTCRVEPGSVRRPSILDVYAIGSLPQVQLVHIGTTLPHLNLFKRGAPRTDINEALVDRLIAEVAGVR